MMKENHDEKVQGESEMITVVDNSTINSALELRDKVDRALSLGIPAETIGAALMMEKGLDPGKIHGPVPRSLDALLVSRASA
jgi:hypothetical protein